MSYNKTVVSIHAKEPKKHYDHHTWHYAYLYHA